MMWYGHDGMGWGGWLAMSLTFVLFWGAIIAFAVWWVRSYRSDHGTDRTPTTDRADEVLAERFARGEIDEDEFTRRRELLHSGHAPSSR